MAHTGILKRLFSDKGYGFIHNESDERDVFVHFSELRWFSKEDLTEGTEVAFDIEQQSGRTKAINVTPRESQAGAWAWAGELSSSDHLVPWVPGHSTEPPRASAAWERTAASAVSCQCVIYSRCHSVPYQSDHLSISTHQL